MAAAPVRWFGMFAQDRGGCLPITQEKPTGRTMYLQENITLPNSDILIS